MLHWEEVDDDLTMYRPYRPSIKRSEMPSRISHLITIEISEDPRSGDQNLIDSVIASMNRDIDNMRGLLGQLGIPVTSVYQDSAGRFSADIKDHGARGLDLATNHYLVTYPTEEPGDETWSDGFDWEVRHEGACTPEMRYDELCPFSIAIDCSGRDLFGDPEHWPEPPFEMRVRYEIIEYGAGPWGPAEYDEAIEYDTYGPPQQVMHDAHDAPVTRDAYFA